MTNHSKSKAKDGLSMDHIHLSDGAMDWCCDREDEATPPSSQSELSERQAVARLMRSVGNRILAALGEAPLDPDNDLLPTFKGAPARFDIAEAFAEVDRIMALPGVLDARARTLCEEVRGELRSEFAAFQVVHPHKHMIETIAAAGPALEWVDAARHPMGIYEGQPYRNDIQADVVLRKRGTVIRGWDDRLDRYLYHKFQHQKALRVFYPFVAPMRLSDRTLASAEELDWLVEVELDRLEIVPVAPPGTELEVIGTIETGFLLGDAHEIDREFLLKLARVSSRHVASIYDATLRSALEKVGSLVMRLCGGESASLHLLRESLNVPSSAHVLYSYNVVIGEAASLARADGHGGGGISDPPRTDGIGASSLSQDQPCMIPDPREHEPSDALRLFNPKIWGEHHVRAMVVFPLAVAIPEGRAELGLLYVHHHFNWSFDPVHIDHVHQIVRRASACLQSILERNEEKERVRQGRALLSMLRDSVPAASSGVTLDDLARNVAYLLEADVVGILPAAADGTWKRPTIVGRVELDRTWTFLNGVAPLLAGIDKSGQGRFVKDARRTRSPEERAAGDVLPEASAQFARQEAIVSAASLALRDRATHGLRGVMYLGFRSYRSFPDTDAKVIRVVGDLVISVMDGRMPGAEPMSAALLLASSGRDSGRRYSGHLAQAEATGAERHRPQ